MHDTPNLDWFDLTSRQRSIWLDLQTSGSLINYQAGIYAEIRQPLDAALMRDAVSDVIERHDALRLKIDRRQPRQRIQATIEPPVKMVDVSATADPQAAALAFIRETFTQPFPIDQSPLFQLIVVRIADDHHYSLLRMHHIALDAIALSALWADIAETYDALKSGTRGLRPQSSYLRFQAEDAAYYDSPRYRRDLDYWQERLADLPDAIFAPRAKDETLDDQSGVIALELEATEYARFLERCAEAKLRPGNTLYALCALLLASVSGRDDVIFGIAVPGRSKDMRETIGTFANVLPLRVDLTSDQPMTSLVAQITQSLGRDYLHHRVSVDDICRSVSVAQRRRQNVFDVMVSYMPVDVVDMGVRFGSQMLRPRPIRGRDANPLAIYASEVSEGQPMTLEFAFNHDYLSLKQVEELSREFRRILAAFIADPETSVATIVAQSEARRPIVVTRGPEKTEAGPTSAPSGPHYRVLAGFTADPIVTPLKYWLNRLGIDGRISLADYNQIFQELVDPSSPTRRNRHGANIVLLRLEDWLRDRHHNAGQEPGDAEDQSFLIRVASELVDAVSKAAATSAVPYLVLICPPSPQWDAGGRHAELQKGLLSLLQERLAGAAGIDFQTYADCRRLYPVTTEYDAASDQLGHLPYVAPAFTALATFAARRIHLATRPPVKVIAVDCDNTLWAGVIAEDGIDGIVIGEEHLALQRRLTEAARSGVLICLCSKNVEADVLAVFERRNDMALKLEHVVAHRINWQPKSENLRSLAAELNLGLDSFVMLDDNPIEIGEISANAPQVLAIQCVIGGDSTAIRFDHLWPLDVRSATSEDRKRVERYRQNALRTKARAAATDYRGFIDSLGLKIRVEHPADGDLPRLAQLTERTNQFNINGQHLSLADINARRQAKDNVVRSIFVEDKFGDYGLVGMLAAHRADSELVVDILLMSCRVLGRGVEHRMIAELGQQAGELGATTVRIPVRVTQRNLPVRQFLDSLGAQKEGADAAMAYVLTREAAEASAFRPEAAEVLDVADDGESGAAAAPARHVHGIVWAEIAGQLSRIDAVDLAVRNSVTVKRSSVAPTTFREPETPTEKGLAEILPHILAIDRIGADDDFFDMGLRSLGAVELVSRIRDRFDIQLPVRTLFEASTIAKLAAEIDSDSGGMGYQPLVPLQVGNGHAPLFCCHPGNGDAVGYMRLANALGPDQTVYGFEASGLAPGEPMAESLEEMARVYVKAMIAAHPSGPYNLLGWSFGGALAFEMARQIEEAGRDIGVLAFMDSVAPGTKGTDVDNIELSNELVLRGLSHQIDVIGHHFGVPVIRSPGQDLTWIEVMDNFQRFGIVPKGYTIEEMQRKMGVFTNCTLIFSRYKPTVIKSPIIHFRALEKLDHWNYNWGPFTAAGVHNIQIRCNHFLIGFEPHVNKVANHLASALRGERPKTSWLVQGANLLKRYAKRTPSREGVS